MMDSTRPLCQMGKPVAIAPAANQYGETGLETRRILMGSVRSVRMSVNQGEKLDLVHFAHNSASCSRHSLVPYVSSNLCVTA